MKPKKLLAAVLFLAAALVLGGLATFLVNAAPTPDAKVAVVATNAPASVPNANPPPQPARPGLAALPTRLALYKQLSVLHTTLASLEDRAPADDPHRQRLVQDEQRLAELGGEVFAENAGDAKALNELAGFILTTPNLQPRDLPLALRAAKAAYDLNGADADIMDTCARALFMTGDTAQAIALQTKAVASQTDTARKAVFAATLKEYERAASALKNHEAAPATKPAAP